MNIRILKISEMDKYRLKFDFCVSEDAQTWFRTRANRNLSALDGTEFFDLWSHKDCLIGYCPELQNFNPRVIKLGFRHDLTETDVFDCPISAISPVLLCDLTSFENSFQVELPWIVTDDLSSTDLDFLQDLSDSIPSLLRAEI